MKLKFTFKINRLKHTEINYVYIRRPYITLVKHWQNQLEINIFLKKRLTSGRQILPCCLLLVSFHAVAYIHRLGNSFYMGKQIKIDKHFLPTEYARICLIET